MLRSYVKLTSNATAPQLPYIVEVMESCALQHSTKPLYISCWLSCLTIDSPSPTLSSTMDTVDGLGLASAVITIAGVALYRGHLPDAWLEDMERAVTSVHQTLLDACEEGCTSGLEYFKARLNQCVAVLWDWYITNYHCGSLQTEMTVLRGRVKTAYTFTSQYYEFFKGLSWALWGLAKKCRRLDNELKVCTPFNNAAPSLKYSGTPGVPCTTTQ